VFENLLIMLWPKQKKKPRWVYVAAFIILMIMNKDAYG
jgi:hypothetical protein